MERFDAACLTDAKKEYTLILIRKLKSPFCSKILDMFQEVKKECAEAHEDASVLVYFQDKLEKVPEWDDFKIQQVSKSIIVQTKCDYLEELLQAVFIVHTKILSVIQSSKSSGKSELKLPTIENFIFQAFINTARELWKFAYLFKEVSNSCEYQENTNSIEKRIQSCIQETVEEMLPVREMLMEHVRDYVVDEDEEKEDNSIEDEDEDDDYIPKRKLKKGLKKRRGGANGVFPNTLLGGNELFAPASLPGPAPVTPVSLPAPMTPASLPAPITPSLPAPVSLPAPAETLPVALAPVALATPPAPVTSVLLPDPAPVETPNDSMTGGDVKTVEIGNSHVSFNEPEGNGGMDGGMDVGMPTDLNFSDLADLPFTQL